MRGRSGSIVVVLPNATHDLLDGLVLFADHKSKIRGAAGRGRPLDAITVSRGRRSRRSSGRSTRAFPGPTDPDNGQPIRGGELPDFAVDPHNGNVYAAWDDDSLNGIDSIFFSQSTDGGFTWSPPIKINQTPTNIPRR